MSMILALAISVVSALVVDDNGEPLAGVSMAPLRQALSGADGRISGSTDSKRVAFRKEGYQTAISAPAEGLVIVMRPAARLTIARCSGGATRFRLPEEGGQSFRDIDYSGRVYEVKTGTGKYYLQHGYGPMWSSGYPVDRWLRESTEYDETRYVGGVTAGRGKLRDGTLWRFLGAFGETISYSTADPQAARHLDAIFDLVCLARAN